MIYSIGNSMRSISISQLLDRAGIPQERISSVMINLHPMDPDGDNPKPEYLKELIERAGITPEQAAEWIGVPIDEMQQHLSGKLRCPYPVQYCLEVLAEIRAS